MVTCLASFFDLNLSLQDAYSDTYARSTFTLALPFSVAVFFCNVLTLCVGLREGVFLWFTPPPPPMQDADSTGARIAALSFGEEGPPPLEASPWSNSWIHMLNSAFKMRHAQPSRRDTMVCSLPRRGGSLPGSQSSVTSSIGRRMSSKVRFEP